MDFAAVLVGYRFGCLRFCAVLCKFSCACECSGYGLVGCLGVVGWFCLCWFVGFVYGGYFLCWLLMGLVVVVCVVWVGSVVLWWFLVSLFVGLLWCWLFICVQ